MYKVVLVEDEATVREGIVRRINWEEHGFRLAGACENGRQALELLRETSVDVVITDINMPVMDGLALAEQIHLHWPNTKVILLTGFDDFSYAQSAIRYRVSEYLLKPITAKQLRELLDRLRKELDASAAAGEQTRAMLRKTALERLLMEELPAEEAEALCRQHGLALLPGPLCAVLLTPEMDAGPLLAEREDKGAFLEDAAGRGVFLYRGTDSAAAAFLRSFEINGSAVIGSAEPPGLVCRSFAAADEAFDRLYRKEAGIYLAEKLLAEPERSPSLSSVRRELLRGVKLLSRDSALEALDKLVAELRESSWTRRMVLSQLHQLLHLLAEYAEEQSLEQPVPLAEMDSQPNLGDAREVIARYVEALIQEAEQKGDATSRLGLLSVEYIRERFQEPGLSLQQITSYLSVSTSHFSGMFKAYTGVTFVEFLTRLRINKAKELLETTDRKNYEVAAAVGYDDPGYFRSIFKKHTGMSPSEYRKRRQSLQ